MRIVGGKHRGRRLVTPSNDRVRPTTDRVRETLFNILTSKLRNLHGLKVLDAFAGTGALGLEALSRGACHVTFSDSHHASLKLVKDNIATLKAIDETTVLKGSAATLAYRSGPFDLVFLDPPYSKGLIPQALENLQSQSALAEGALVVAEMAKDDDLPEMAGLSLVDDRQFGLSRVAFLSPG